MIHKGDIDSAIAECEVEPLTAAKLEKLAHLYIVRESLFGKQNYDNWQSTSAKSVEMIVEIGDGSEFSRAIDGKRASDAWQLMCDLVDTLEVLHPKLHSSLIKKIGEIQ